MKQIDVQRAKAALLEKSVLGYRKAGAGDRLVRTSDAKVGVVKTPSTKAEAPKK
jgi:hypothetical protein